MPVLIDRPTRRQFLKLSAAGAMSVLWYDMTFASTAPTQADPNRMLLFSDTHINEDAGKVIRGVNMTDHMSKAIAQATAVRPTAAAMIVCGDCVLRPATAADYAQLHKLTKPVYDAKLPLHLMMGNHDNRDFAQQAFSDQRTDVPDVSSKLIHVVQTPNATWVLMDSLDQLNTTPGSLGDEQIQWLGKLLDQIEAKQGRDVNVILGVHHNPPWDERGKTLALQDSEALMQTILPRKIVKAMFFGHTHRYYEEEREGVHLIGLPAVAYVFREGEPSGWSIADVKPSAMQIQLNCLDTTHELHHDEREFKFRQR